MVDTFEFNGKIYRRYPQSKRRTDRVYYQRVETGGTKRLHRVIWEHHNGPIPQGWHVHHKDGNPDNNDIANLESMSLREHVAEHPYDAERLEAQRVHLDNIRHLTREWHASPEGRAKHREIGGLAYAGFKPEPKQCEQCAEAFLPRKIGNLDRFCSNKCKAAHRRSSGVDNEFRTCPQCDGQFEANRYSKTQTCSRACSNRYRNRSGGACL